MIPVAQLDPSSLTMWLDPALVSHSGPKVSETISLATHGDVAGVAQLVEGVDEPHLQARCADLAGVIWHEQRHFLDLVLTNYGAFRFRQFASIYINVPQLLRDGRPDGIHCPISAYADPVRARLHGLEEPPESLSGQASDVVRRSRMHHDDSLRVATPSGILEIGGEAQLEALAYISQQLSLLRTFGYDVARNVHEDLPEDKRQPLRYSWLLWFAASLNLLPTLEIDDTTLAWDVTLLYSVLLGGLAVRRWKQEQSQHGESSSGHAASRLQGLIEACRRHDPGQGVRPAEAWQMVNDAAEQMWGRSVIEEMSVDYERESEWLELVADHAMPVVTSALTDLHDLRGKLLTVLRNQPEFIVDPDLFPSEVLPTLRPLPVLARPGGQTGNPSNGWSQLMGYRHPTSPKEHHWWWAAVPDVWPTDDEVVALQSRESWIEIAEWLAPLAKLLTHGRRHRVMLGPELISAEARLKQEGFTFRIDPRYAFPDETDGPRSARFFYDITAQSDATCDWCNKKIAAPSGGVLSPWALRKYPALFDEAVAKYGGGEDGYLRMIKDWSVWLLCDTCAGEIDDALDSAEPALELRV